MTGFVEAQVTRGILENEDVKILVGETGNDCRVFAGDRNISTLVNVFTIEAEPGEQTRVSLELHFMDEDAAGNEVLHCPICVDKTGPNESFNSAREFFQHMDVEHPTTDLSNLERKKESKYEELRKELFGDIHG